ncbi:MAG: transposase [Candidatus Blackburnbacteria bacterium]|nr:transposase [Candidatus Blackburnbacteria bacterium]
MPGRKIPLVNGEFYHIINRGSDNRKIFLTERDYKRFLSALFYYQYHGPKPKFSNLSAQKLQLWKPKEEDKLVNIICYCLMSNHIHLLVQQLKDDGISIFMSQLCNSYTKYFNTKHKRIGPLLQGRFKSVLVGDDYQLLHVSRYIHINPVVARMVIRLEDYTWSSFAQYVGSVNGFCTPKKIMEQFKSPQEYKKILEDQIGYGETLETIKNHLADDYYDDTSGVES